MRGQGLQRGDRPWLLANFTTVKHDGSSNVVKTSLGKKQIVTTYSMPWDCPTTGAFIHLFLQRNTTIKHYGSNVVKTFLEKNNTLCVLWRTCVFLRTQHRRQGAFGQKCIDRCNPVQIFLSFLTLGVLGSRALGKTVYRRYNPLPLHLSAPVPCPAAGIDPSLGANSQACYNRGSVFGLWGAKCHSTVFFMIMIGRVSETVRRDIFIQKYTKQSLSAQLRFSLLVAAHGLSNAPKHLF